jgi:RHS repeat-associated protein
MSLNIEPSKRRKLIIGVSAFAMIFLIGLGIMARNGWLPRTDAVSGKKTGWFGSESSPTYEGGVAASRGRGGSLDPANPPTATPQLSKEFLYAGSRLLVVEDANANAAPPADLAVWRPSTGVWWVMGGQGSQPVAQGWGTNGDVPAQGDFDSDGKTDFSIYRPTKTIEVEKSYLTTGANSGRQRGGTSYQTAHMEFRVVDRITLPSQLGNLFYEFDYNSEPGGANGWGEISKLKMPSGATVDYEYTTPNIIARTDTILRNHVSEKTLTYNAEYDGSSTTVTEVTNYNIGKTGSTVTNPDGSTVTESYGDSSYQNLLSGVVYRTVHSNGSRTERIWTYNRPPGANTGANINAYVKTEFTTIADANGNPSLTTIKDVTIDPNGNQTDILEYDWVAYSAVPKDSNGMPTGIPGSAVLKRKTVSAYNNSANGNTANAYWAATAPAVRNAASSVEIRDGSNNSVSRTELIYDNPATTANPIETKAWDSAKGTYSNPLTTANSISMTATYNQYGMPLTTTDAKGNVTQITYGSINGYTDLYPTQTVAAYGTSVARTLTAAYDFYTGLVTTATDVDNNVSTVTEYDALGRAVKVRSAANTPLESWVQTSYDDVNRRVIVKSDIDTIGDARKVATQFFDQLGRVRLSKTLEDAATQSATNETDGIKVQTRYSTGNPNSYQLTSNPYRANYPSNETDPTMGWTRSKAWNTGRKQQLETFSGGALPVPWGNNANSSGVVTTDIDADRTLVTDQAGKQRISKTNSLGQLKVVWEIMTVSDSTTESVTFPNTSIVYGYITSYSYDALNNLTAVNQGAQTRAFSYSSLSRLLSANNPESATITHSYDANGNLIQKTDARNITTAYTYDALNRVTQRSYNDNPQTPTVTYTYDNVTNAKGKLTKVSSSVSTTEYTSFDILSRVTAHKQSTDGNDYATNYVYNLAGVVIEETYPSTRKVRNILDSNGDLSLVQSKKNANFGFFTYANSFTYNAASAVTSIQLGNGRWESFQFNSRLQPTQIALGTTQNTTDKLKLEYGYGSTVNNGNVLSQKITVVRSGQSDLVFDQTYTYDELNRLKIAEEKTGTTTNWKQTFTFDRYGNRNFDRNNTTQPSSFENPSLTDPAVNDANNRFASGQGYTYDASGNVIIDANGNTFTYNPENKQVQANNSNNSNLGTYYFDGDGKRVKKTVPSTGETTIFVYNAGGKLVAEYSTIIQSNENAKVQYLTNDNLGTPRINTDRDGNVVSRNDYLPYGEEIVGLGNRSAADKYVADDVRQGFTGYINDGETGLDYAQARMYAKNLGRFTGPDDFLNDTKPIEPAGWNLYVYVRNSPLSLVDSQGEEIYNTNLSEEEQKKLIEDYKKKNGYKNIYFDKDKKLVVDTKAGFEGGSKSARTQLLDAVTTTEKRFNLESVNSTDVAFAQVDAGAITTDSSGKKIGPTVFNVQIDFKDFNQFKGGSSSEAIAAFTVAIAVFHEIAHKLYAEIKDTPNSDSDPGPVETKYINPIRRELGLAERKFYTARATPDSVKAFFPGGGRELVFTLNGKEKVLRWQKDTVGGKVE